jgi:hypothetical protein
VVVSIEAVIFETDRFDVGILEMEDDATQPL